MKNKIESYTRQKLAFIDNVRAIFAKTKNRQEEANRNEAFDALLLTATFAKIDVLERDMDRILPKGKTDTTINYMMQQLREINGFCTSSFSDNHEVYQDLFASLAFPTPEAKQNIRDMLRSSMVKMILDKTNAHDNGGVIISPRIH